MGDLEGPDHFAAGDFQRYHGIGVMAVTRPVAAEEIGAGAGGRQEQQPARFIDAHRRPDIGGAGAQIPLQDRIESAKCAAPVTASKARTVPRNSSIR